MCRSYIHFNRNKSEYKFLPFLSFLFNFNYQFLTGLLYGCAFRDGGVLKGIPIKL